MQLTPVSGDQITGCAITTTSIGTGEIGRIIDDMTNAADDDARCANAAERFSRTGTAPRSDVAGAARFDIDD